MILSTDEIEALCNSDPKKSLVYPYDPNDNLGNPAKIELHLGQHCFCSNEPDKIYTLSDGDTVYLKPNTIFLFETKEIFNFPKTLSGKMSLKMSMVAKGLLMSNQTTIDPGYNNVLFGMLYNLSSEEIELKYGQAITTLEIMRAKASKRAYTGKIEKMSFAEFVKTRIHSSLGVLEHDIKKSKEDITVSQKRLDRSTKIWNVLFGFITLLVTALTIFIGVTNFRATSKDDADIEVLKYQIEILQEKIKNQEDNIDDLEKLIIEYQEKIIELEELISRKN